MSAQGVPRATSSSALKGPAACGLALACLLVAISGCGRRDEAADVEFLYDTSDYAVAEAAVEGQVRARLEDDEIELRGLWLGLRPVEDGPNLLNADVDVYSSPDRAEEISRMVGEIALNALPKHEAVQVRVFWWRDMPGDDWAHPAGSWTWNAEGKLVRHEQPKYPDESRPSGRT